MMKKNEWTHLIWGVAGCVAVGLVLSIGSALAAIPSTTAYHFSSHPMISGTVVTVNDREMVVDTDQGERVTLELDSHTLAPRNLAPGMVMRAEFLALEDCRLVAQRVVALRDGMSSERTQAYANAPDDRPLMARGSSGFGGYRREPTASVASAERHDFIAESEGEPTSGRMMTATPGTADYLFSTKPMISGLVHSVNDHRLVIVTDQGQQIGLNMDSRTLVPGEVAPGSIVRAEFTQMKDGRYYAKRISQIGSGVASREQAYANTHDSDAVMARNSLDCGPVSAGSQDAVSSAVEQRRGVVTDDLVAVDATPAPSEGLPTTLPQTAGTQPLILALGLFALASAGAIAGVRGLKAD